MKYFKQYITALVFWGIFEAALLINWPNKPVRVVFAFLALAAISTALYYAWKNHREFRQ